MNGNQQPMYGNQPQAPGTWSQSSPMFSQAPTRQAPQSLYRDPRANSVVTKPAKYA